jgi:hypothetical protein
MIFQLLPFYFPLCCYLFEVHFMIYFLFINNALILQANDYAVLNFDE